MRYLGIDYGLKNIGLSISDVEGNFVFPLKVLENSDQLVDDISLVCKENNISEIVVVESKDYAQKENEIMKEVKPFVEVLKQKLSIPVHFHPEFLTSMEAERLQGKNDMHDASAAALILKSYLDTLKNHG